VLDLVARAADGSYRDALGLLDQLATYGGGRVEVGDVLELFGAVEREEIFELADHIAAGDAAGAFEQLEATLDRGADPEQLIRGLVTHLRFLCLLQQGAHPREDWAYSPDELDRLRAQANQLPPSRVVRGLDLIADAQVRIRHGQADPRIQIELVAAKLSHPALDANVQALAGRIEALERGQAPAGGHRPATPPPAAAPPDDAAAAPEPVHLNGEPEPAQEAPVPQRPKEPIAADMDHVGRIWPQVVAELEQQHARVHGFLKDSTVTAVDDGGVTIAVSGVFARILDQPDERTLVERALSQFAGRHFAVRFVEASAAGPHEVAEPEPALDHEALMEELKRTFNATEE